MKNLNNYAIVTCKALYLVRRSLSLGHFHQHLVDDQSCISCGCIGCSEQIDARSSVLTAKNPLLVWAWQQPPRCPSQQASCMQKTGCMHGTRSILQCDIVTDDGGCSLRQFFANAAVAALLPCHCHGSWTPIDNQMCARRSTRGRSHATSTSTTRSTRPPRSTTPSAECRPTTSAASSSRRMGW